MNETQPLTPEVHGLVRERDCDSEWQQGLFSVVAAVS